MVGAPPPTSLHGHLPPLVNLISSLFHCLGSFVPLQSPSLCSQAHALFYKLSKEFFNRLTRFCMIIMQATSDFPNNQRYVDIISGPANPCRGYDDPMSAPY